MFCDLWLWRVEKHAAVARSTFGRKMVKHTSVGALLGVEMLKKCTRLWRKAHFQVKTRYNYYNDDSCMQLQLR
jgi:hypothetical protein